MANSEFRWNEGMFYDGSGDGRKKRKKDPYENPLGLSDKMPGITRDTEDTLRENQERDTAIGRAATQPDKPVPIVNIPDVPCIRPQPRSSLDAVQSDTDKPVSSGNHFNYGTKTVDTRPTEEAKREKNHEDSLSITGGNEGYTLPPMSPSTGNGESDPGEKEKLAGHHANEGFTLPNQSSTDETSGKWLEETTAFLERFLSGNEKEQRFANGLPAPGEEHRSVMGTYLDTKNKSDNAIQGDWGKTVGDLNTSPFGQGVRDIYHGGARGLYEQGNTGLTLLGEMVQQKPFAPFPYPVTPYAILDRLQQNFSGDKKLDSRYQLYKMKKNLKDRAQEHQQAQSEDYKNTG